MDSSALRSYGSGTTNEEGWSSSSQKVLWPAVFRRDDDEAGFRVRRTVYSVPCTVIAGDKPTFRAYRTIYWIREGCFPQRALDTASAGAHAETRSGFKCATYPVKALDITGLSCLRTDVCKGNLRSKKGGMCWETSAPTHEGSYPEGPGDVRSTP